MLPGSEIVYGGRNLVELGQDELRKLRGADISMIFQEPMTSLNPVFTVGFQLIEVAAPAHGHGAGGRRGSARSSCSRRSVFPTPSSRSTPIRRRCRAASSSA